MSVEDQLTQLQALLGRLDQVMGLPPVAGIARIVTAVETGQQVAATPPAPLPAALAEAAVAWRTLAQTWRASEDLLCATRITTDDSVWEGLAGTQYRASLKNLEGRIQTVHRAFYRIADALEDCETHLTAAHQSYHEGRQLIESARQMPLPTSLEHVDERVCAITTRLREGSQAIMEGYRHAAAATAVCEQTIRCALESVELPHERAPGLSAMTTTALLTAARNDRGPLRPGVLRRARTALANMSPTQREEVQRLLAQTKEDRRAWILAAVADGMSGVDLYQRVIILRSLSTSELQRLDSPHSAP